MSFFFLHRSFYKNIPNWDVFEYALEHSENPVCYNGDLCTVEDFEIFCERFPAVDRIMIGRGLIGNPGLVREIQTGETVRLEEVSGFMWALKEAYQECMADNPVLFKMKEIWVYLAELYPQGEQLWKKIKKAKRLSEYEKIVLQVNRI